MREASALDRRLDDDALSQIIENAEETAALAQKLAAPRLAQRHRHTARSAKLCIANVECGHGGVKKEIEASRFLGAPKD